MTYAIEASSPSQKSIYMGRVKLKYQTEVINGSLDFFQLFMSATDDVEGPYIASVNGQKTMTILDSLLEHFLLHE